MPRIDYDEIKGKFAEFVETWKTKDSAKLDGLVVPQVSCLISAAPNANDEWDKLIGIRHFVETYPKTDVLQLAIYCYACRLNGNEAQMAAHVICESLNYVDGQEEMDAFYYAIIAAAHWVKSDEGWKMDEIRLDVYPFIGNLREYFEQTWYFGSKLAEAVDGVRLPAIVGEYDLPWVRLPEAEDVLTEIEQIKEACAKKFLGADYLVNDLRITARSKHITTNAVRFGVDQGRRELVSALRYKRQRDRYWAHPYRFEDIEMNEDMTRAICRIYRVFGWKQRNHEYVWTRSNVNIEHTCNCGYQEFVKEDGEWRVADGYLKLGIYEVGPYSETYYGDKI